MGKPWQYSPRPHSNYLSFEVRMNWEILCPNLRLTIESKIGSLHKTRLLAF